MIYNKLSALLYALLLLHNVVLTTEKQRIAKNIFSRFADCFLIKIKMQDWDDEKPQYYKPYFTPIEVAFDWQGVIGRNKNAKKLLYFLEKHDTAILQQENYNPFNHILLNKLNINEFSRLVTLMVDHKADPNQEEKRFNVVPVCNECEEQKVHQCLLIKNKKYVSKTIDTENSDKVYVGYPPTYARQGSQRSTCSSNAGVTELFSMPLWNIVNDYSEHEKINACMRVLIENKMDVNKRNVLIDWAKFGKSINRMVGYQECILDYALHKKVSPDVISFLVKAGCAIQISGSQYVNIGNQKFKVRCAKDFCLFRNLDAYSKEQKNELINIFVEENNEFFIQQKEIPIFISSSVDHQMGWLRNIIKDNKIITKNDIQDFADGASRFLWSGESRDCIIKALNYFLNVIQYQNQQRMLGIISQVERRKLPKTIIKMIAEYVFLFESDDLRSLIEGMTTVKTYLRPDKEISLYNACREYSYEKNLYEFFEKFFIDKNALFKHTN